MGKKQLSEKFNMDYIKGKSIYVSFVFKNIWYIMFQIAKQKLLNIHKLN